MKEKLSRLKDWLVFALSFEVNIILTLILFNVDIWNSIWQVARINIAVLFFYGWLWFIDLYLNNYSAAAVEEKRRLAKEAALNPQPIVKPKPVVEHKPETKPIDKPQSVVQPKPEPVIEPKPEPVIEQKIVVEPAPSITSTESNITYEEGAQTYITHSTDVEEVVVDTRPNKEQLLAWIQEEEDR